MNGSIAERCERSYKRGSGPVQVRTNAGRLVSSSQHVEWIEYQVINTRVLWQRFSNLGRVVWLARSRAD